MVEIVNKRGRRYQRVKKPAANDPVLITATGRVRDRYNLAKPTPMPRRAFLYSRP